MKLKIKKIYILDKSTDTKNGFQNASKWNKNKEGGVLNQGNDFMEFVLSNKNTVRDHTLDGYSVEGNKLVEDKTKSIQGYLKRIDNSKNMSQLGKNLYTALPIKSKDMIEGIADLIRRIKDKENRKSLSDYVTNNFEKDNIDYNKKSFLKSIKLKDGGYIK